MARIARMALATALVTTNSIAFGADGLTTLSVGADSSTGKYGQDQSTHIFFVPITGKYEAGPWTLKLLVPYIRITGPGNVIGAGDSRITLPGKVIGGTTLPPGVGAARRTEVGLGDVVASGFYNVFDERSAPIGLDLGVKIKFATADDSKGLGTGKNDYAGQADFFKAIGAFTAFGTIGYRWYGDPAGIDLRNVPYAAVGASYRVSQPTSVGFVYDWRNRIVQGGARVSELTAYVSRKFSADWKLQVYAVKGFTDGSPDFGGGLTLAYSF